VTSPEGVEVNAVAVKGRNHRKAGEPAFGRFRLQDNREAPPATEVEKIL